MDTQNKHIEKLILILIPVSLFIVFTGMLGETVSGVIKEHIEGNNFNTTYKLAIFSQYFINNSKHIMNLIISIFLYSQTTREMKLTWLALGFLFGFWGLIFFLANKMHSIHQPIENHTKSINCFLWGIIFLNLFIAAITYFQLITATAVTEGYITSLSLWKFFLVITGYLPKVAIAVLTWKLSSVFKMRKWVWATSALFFGIASPIALSVYTATNTKNG